MLDINQTIVGEFLLLGFQDLQLFQIPIFVLIILMYSLTVVGNFLIFALILSSYQLHTPMYLFLSNLSLCDLIISTNVAPKTLQIILAGRSTIPAIGCIIQLYFFGASAIIECCLLTVMSYDRYLAICKPLQYTTIMNLRLLYFLLIWSWMAGFILSLVTIILLLQLQFCGPNVIDHFFCDLAPLIELSCTDTSFIQTEVSVAAILFGILQFVFITVSYICIFTNILQISSTTGRKKVFSTCSSHMVVVCIYYGTMVILYVAPSKEYSITLNKVLSLLNTMLTPLFNPVIYSLRNKEIKTAVSKLVLRILISEKQFICNK